MLLFRRCPFLNPRTLRKVFDPNRLEWTNDWGIRHHPEVGHNLPHSGRREFEHGRGGAAATEPPGRDISPDLDHATPLIQEDQVQREAHAERVDAPAVRNQQAIPGPLPRQKRQPE
jgi:hypothetical protein